MPTTEPLFTPAGVVERLKLQPFIEKNEKEIAERLLSILLQRSLTWG